MTNLLLIFGGCSPEYEVSLQSASAVIAHLESERFRERFRTVCLGITRDGQWYRYYGGTERIADGSWCAGVSDPASESDGLCRPAWISQNRGEGLVEMTEAGPAVTRIDLAFPVLHGKNGEDGTVQGLLELAGIPVVGCGTLASALCMDKDRAHKLAKLAGVDVPRSVTLRRTEFEEDRQYCAEGGGDCAETLPRMIGIPGALRFPVFVKPLRAGSSFGISRVCEAGGLVAALEKAFEYDDTAVVEEAVSGFEVGCAVMGTEPETLICGRADEIELADGFFDYREKYTLETSKIHCPARIDRQTEQRVQQCAKVIYRALGCSGLARVDLFLTPAGRIVFNEVNTIPGFTAHSRYPNMMKAAGMPFPDMLDRLLTMYL